MRTDRLLLLDILDAIAEILQHLPTDRSAYDADKFLRSHLLRHIQIIGEAVRRLSKALKDCNPQIAWRNIEGMRHVLVHDYFKVDWERLWETASRDVPALKPLIEAILDSLPPEDQP